jgi:O-antigen/teichoic acid export membrane protein
MTGDITSSYQKTGMDTLKYGIATLLTSLVPLIQLPLLTKVLGAANYGLWAQARATVNLLVPLSSLGLATAMTRFLAAEKNKNAIQKGFYSVVTVKLIIALVIASAILILTEPLAGGFFDGAVPIVRLTSALFLAATLEPVYMNLLRTFRQIGKYSFFHIADRYGCLGAIAYAVLSGYGLLGALLAYLAVRVVLIIVLSVLVWSQIGIGRPGLAETKKYLRFGLPLAPWGIGYWIVNLSDRYVIGYFLGATHVGAYAAAYELGQVPLLISAVMAFILMAALSRLYDEGRMDEVKTHLSYSLKYLLALVIPFIFGATMLAEPVLRLFSIPEIAARGRFVMPVVALSFSILGIHTIVSHVLLLAKRTKILAFSWVIAAPVNLGLNILVVPHWGIIGAAVTTLISFLLALIIAGYYSVRELRFDIHGRFIVKSVIASIVMSLVVWLMAPVSQTYTILTVIAGVVVYGVALVLLKGFTRTEFQFFKELLRNNRA